ncbi:hypothetical protein [Piscinibacter sp.]|uniref:hypothetical protein n=1 Tax=Piscinibacter sp. TaxID=1903157 RepID=UPI002CCD0412|nr:hypothetical protein [Albitalea sp.]HUG21621.1 hypothetical protein [Albitalea sp.]
MSHPATIQLDGRWRASFHLQALRADRYTSEPASARFAVARPWDRDEAVQEKLLT